MGRALDPTRLGDHIDRLYRAACGLTGSRPAADDLVQDTYARVLAKPRLLKNDDDILPLSRETKIAVIGEFARTPRYQGAGSSQVVPTRLDTVLAQLEAVYGDVPFAAGYGLSVRAVIHIGPAE